MWHPDGVSRKNKAASAQTQATEAARPASLKTLAEHLHLSSATISRVLSGSPAARAIPKSTQDRILAAAKEFHYQPNAFARSLRIRRSMTVGILVPELSEGYATLVLSGIEQHLLEQNYFYFVVSHHHRDDLIERYQRLLIARSVEGILAIDTFLPHTADVPTVMVSGHHEPTGVTNIVLNHRRAAALAIDHLAALGHTDIAFIKGQDFSSDTEARWQGIRHAAAKRQLEIVPELVAQLEGSSPIHIPGYLAAQRLLETGRCFTALFAFNDISAIGAIRALREAGWRVPEDVSVIGFDDVQSAAFHNPGLTTVRQPLHTMGVLAAQRLLAQIDPQPSSHKPLPRVLRVDPELIVRETTCPPAPHTIPNRSRAKLPTKRSR
jgi:DNA-binding LacI/PurR family transcriptional regulator